MLIAFGPGFTTEMTYGEWIERGRGLRIFGDTIQNGIKYRSILLGILSYLHKRW